MKNKLKEIKSEKQKSVGYKRLAMLFDDENFTELDSFVKSGNIYSEVVSGFGYVNGCPVYAFSQNIDSDGASVSKSQISKILKVYNLAAKTGVPIVGLYDSVGARLNEGNELLSLYSEWLKISNDISGVVPQISLVLGTCYGTSSIIASNADILLMIKNAQIGIDISGEKSSREYVETHGISHIVCNDEREAILKTREIVKVLPSNNLEVPAILEKSVSNFDVSIKENCDIMKIFDNDSFIEFQSRFGQAFTIGLAKLEGKTVGAILSNFNCNDGIIDVDSCSKVSRFIRFCDAFSIPILTFINAKGFSSLREACKFSSSYSEATTIKITIITGEVYGPLYISLAGNGVNSDIVLAWPNTIVSMLPPETGAIIMYQDDLKSSSDPIKDRQLIIDKYKKVDASAVLAANGGFVDEIIEICDTKNKIVSYLDMLSGKRVSTLPKKHSNMQL